MHQRKLPNPQPPQISSFWERKGTAPIHCPPSRDQETKRILPKYSPSLLISFPNSNFLSLLLGRNLEQSCCFRWISGRDYAVTKTRLSALNIQLCAEHLSLFHHHHHLSSHPTYNSKPHTLPVARSIANYSDSHPIFKVLYIYTRIELTRV